MKETSVLIVSPLQVLVLLLLPLVDAQLRRDFYSDVCPEVESIVRAAVSQKLQQTPITAPGTLRLFFHDCFVRGCDASVMLVKTDGNDERQSSDGISLAGDGFDTVVKAKAAVDSNPQCKNKVSCADILAMAARDVVSLTGGPFYPVELGRLDGKISTKAGVRHRLPHPNFNLDQLNSMFASHDLTQTDMIALSGGHTIGFSHCSRFARRIYRFNRSMEIDPTMDRDYALQLRRACPPDADPRVAITLDPATPQAFDNAYFQNLQKGMGLFTSDQVLFSDPRSRATVDLFASNNSAFEEAFALAMTKLGRVGVKTRASEGDIRLDCSVSN